MTLPIRSPWALVAQHSTALVALVYLFSAIAGTTYHFFLFRYFGLDVFTFWELADFLASGVRQPLILLFAGLAVWVAAGIIWNEQFDAWAAQKGPVTRFLFGNTLYEKLGLSIGNYPLLGAILGAAMFSVLSWDLATDQGKAIAAGKQQRVLVYPGPDGSAFMRAGLISRTYGFVIVVAAATGDRYAVPLESIDAIGLCGDSSWESCNALFAPPEPDSVASGSAMSAAEQRAEGAAPGNPSE